MRVTLRCLLCFVVSSLSSKIHAQETKVLRSQLSDQTAVALTVYSNGRSMVRERRQLKLGKGRFALELQDVSSEMLSETAQLRNINAPDDLLVLEQNLEFDLLSPSKLLEKFLGRKVSVIRTHPTNGSESSESAEVLSTQNGIVLKMKDRIETGIPGRISFPEVPKNLRAEPTLSLLVESRKSGQQVLELNYLSRGINWKADYIAELSGNDDSVDLTGFVTVTNQSGTAFRNAKLQLMAGNIQTVEDPRVLRRSNFNDMSADSAETLSMSMRPSHMQGESFFEYHLYTLPRQTTLSSNQTKQLTLLQVARIPARKEIIFATASPTDNSGAFEPTATGDGDETNAVELGDPIPGGVFLTFENEKKSRLGMALPAGVVRVYKRDKGMQSQFLGEDRIRHVPENERVRVRLGTSFDVTARKNQKSFRVISVEREGRTEVRVIEFINRVTLSNAKSSEEQVVYRDKLPADSKVLDSNLKHTMLGRGNVEWKTTVPAQGTRVLEYKVRAKL